MAKKNKRLFEEKDTGKTTVFEREDRCDVCHKQHLGLRLHVKLPESIVLCEKCVPKKRDLRDRLVPYRIGDDL